MLLLAPAALVIAGTQLLRSSQERLQFGADLCIAYPAIAVWVLVVHCTRDQLPCGLQPLAPGAPGRVEVHHDCRATHLKAYAKGPFGTSQPCRLLHNLLSQSKPHSIREPHKSGCHGGMKGLDTISAQGLPDPHSNIWSLERNVLL